jgi:AmmeMemoRadiSam system protein B
MTIRPPAVAGTFYPADPQVLAETVDRHLAAGRERLAAPGAAPPRALIAPHAGYVYSGPIAGTAYAAIAPRAAALRRVVLLGPAHRARLRGLGASGADGFATPLGIVRVDRAALDRVRDVVATADAAHAREHSLEVQLPFLQRLLPELAVVPLVVGDASGEEVAAVLDHLWDGDDTLVVVSSDLSHYYDAATAERLDGATCAAIEALDPAGLDRESACGRIPIAGLLLSARRRGLRARVLDRRHSGDTAGPRDEVVGYAAIAFS